tara:strand:- start:30 stop:497 length:468 start_codon:yes stop_codon:yes gene_type:complete
MKLDELKKMIAEEFESYMKEDDVDVSVGADDVDAEMGGDEEQNPEEALEKIYQMLQAYFEKDGEDNDNDGIEDEPGEEPMEEMSYEEDKEKELDENSTTAAQYQKTGMAAGGSKTAGKDVGYGAVGGKGRTGYDAGSKALQERFQKLANIKPLKG